MAKTIQKDTEQTSPSVDRRILQQIKSLSCFFIYCWAVPSMHRDKYDNENNAHRNERRFANLYATACIRTGHPPWVYANFTVLSSIEPELLPIEVLDCGEIEFSAFLLLWSWPWPDDLHIRTWPYMIFPRTKNEHSTSRLSKVVVLHTYIETENHTDRCHRKYYHAAFWVVNIKYRSFLVSLMTKCFW